jgi:hypothetical protein
MALGLYRDSRLVYYFNLIIFNCVCFALEGFLVAIEMDRSFCVVGLNWSYRGRER